MTSLHFTSLHFPPKRREQRSFNPALNQGFAPLCPCHDYHLKVFTRDKAWQFTLFLLLPAFRRANRRLIVNALAGAHLSQEMLTVVSIQPEDPFFLPHEMQTGGHL